MMELEDLPIQWREALDRMRGSALTSTNVIEGNASADHDKPGGERCLASIGGQPASVQVIEDVDEDRTSLVRVTSRMSSDHAQDESTKPIDEAMPRADIAGENVASQRTIRIVSIVLSAAF